MEKQCCICRANFIPTNLKMQKQDIVVNNV